MKRTAFLCACVMLTFIACGDKRPPKSPEAAVEEPTTEEPDAKKSSTPSTPEAPGTPGNATPAPDPKPTCGSLQKSLCKVTQGCAWYDQGAKSKCIEEGSTP